MVVVPIEDALVVILHFLNGRSWHAVAAVGIADPDDFFAQAAQGVIHLHRLARRYVVIRFAGHRFAFHCFAQRPVPTCSVFPSTSTVTEDFISRER